MSLVKELKVAKFSAVKASKYLKNNFNKFDRSSGVKIKGPTQIQTAMDLGAEKIILNLLKKSFPKASFWSEEAGKIGKQDGDLWIVDPLDGTTNYALGLKSYCASIALARNGKIVLGVVAVPDTGQLFWAESGKGAWEGKKKLQVSKKSKLDEAFLTFCHGSRLPDLKTAVKLYQAFKLKGLEYRQIGSAALELSLVACGRTEAINIPGANLYDVAASALLVQEAGGKVTDFTGKLWQAHPSDLLAANSLIHAKILAIIKKTLK
jgi:myo-inositol-1(or 4)-monophosphatase